jgi:hypothetical protein
MEQIILVFKTNLEHKQQLKEVQTALDGLEGINSWNTDLEDCDRILRVVSQGAKPEAVIHHMQGLGYFCEELPD